MDQDLRTMLDNLKKKATEIAKVVKEDATIGAKMGKHKVKELDLERQKLIKLVDLGKKALALYKKGTLVQNDLNGICESIIKIEKEASKQKAAFTQQKKKLKKIPIK